MLHQDPNFRLGTQSRGRGTSTKPVNVLAYRSRPLTPPTLAQLEAILSSAQRRNRIEGLTGLLIYDSGCFFQWLEGPKLSLLRVWESIRRDPRHTDIKILRQQSVPKRFFSDWDMRLARRTRGQIERTLALMESPQELLSRLKNQPVVLAERAWDSVFSNRVLPHLVEALCGLGRVSEGIPRESGGGIWHAPHSAAAQLAALLRDFDPLLCTRFVDTLVVQGAELEPLFTEVFEPAARCLGGWWDEDCCDEFSVTAALARLQIEARRLSAALMAPNLPGHPGRTVLVASQPGELHGLNRTMGSELFLRDGWDVSCEILSDDNVLREILHRTWFDVLDLSVSPALRRDQQFAALRFTIRAARAASLNPALAVIVDGRSFFEQPLAYLAVGADFGCRTMADLVPAAVRFLSTH